jgi:hypothetical protein
MSTDYINQWPTFAPQWCDDEIRKAQAELADKTTPPTYVRWRELEQRIEILRRIKADYEALFRAQSPECPAKADGQDVDRSACAVARFPHLNGPS